MICSNCNNEIPDNTKFCTKCGTKFVNDVVVLQPASVYQKEQPLLPSNAYGQMPAYNATSQYLHQMSIEMQLQELKKKNNKLKIGIGVLGALTACFLFCWINASDAATQAENRLSQYENRGVLDKTFDALDAWAPLIDMIK